jgi:hypothetical protein
MLIGTEAETELVCAETDMLDGVPYSDSVYPQEVIDRWDRDSELTELKIKTGEIQIKSLREQFEEHGFKFD